MRTYEEIQADIKAATSANEIAALSALAEELQALGTPHALASAENALGTRAALTDDNPLALEHYRRALALQEEMGNDVKVARVIGNIGTVYWNIGDYPSALEHYLRALALHKELGDQIGVARVTGNMGNLYVKTGDYPAALEHFRRALDLNEDLGDRAGVALVTGNMGNVYDSTGDYPAALEHYRRALAVHEELGERRGAAIVTGNIGKVYKNTGDYPVALEYYHRALALHEELGHRASIALVTGNVGIVHGRTGNYPAALENLRRALALYDEVGDLAGVALVTGNIISTLMEMDQHETAAVMLDHQTSMTMDNSGVRVGHKINCSTLAEFQGDLDAAHDHLIEALAIAIETGQRDLAAGCHEKLRGLAQKRNDFAGFIEHNAEFLRITEEIRGKETTQRLTMMAAERKAEAVERERQKERALLYGALPKSVADRMIRGEDVTGDHFDNATVMFLDIVGFTSHTSLLPPTDVVKLLETIFITIDSICDKHNVVKIKTIGDSYMCFRGDADATANAQSIALVALDVMKGAFTWPNGDPLEFRVGIHIGPATAGVIGTQRLQYDVWGDTVNVASRMESSGEAGRVNVSGTFAVILADNSRFDVESRGPINVKGKGPMEMYFLRKI